MAINPKLLIAAPMLQDYLVDKATGLPLAGGVVTLYTDSSKTVFKNWYYDAGTAGSPNFVPLSNPLTLSSVGTIADPNGNDVIPYYYPFSEIDNTTPQPYYITVYNSQGTLQFTRANFPYNPQNAPAESNPTLQNLIVNNVFWRNQGQNIAAFPANQQSIALTIAGNPVTYYYQTICPGAHDGYGFMSDIQYFKDVDENTDVISFNQFFSNFTQQQIFTDDVTPEYYMNVTCNSSGSSTKKFVQIPIQLHINNLSGYGTASCVIEACADASSVSKNISLSLFQFLGTGVSSPTPTILGGSSITLGTNWTKYIVTFTFPLKNTVSVAGDDAYYLQVNFPVGTTFNINIAKPSVYLSESVPTNDFDTYDKVASVISLPRTGDYRTSLNTFQPGWVLCNDGSIGTSSSSATARANNDTWPLYNLIWSNVNNAFAPVSGGRGASAYADFNANKAMNLTLALGRSLIGLPPAVNVTYAHGTTPSWSAVAGVFTVSSGDTSLLYQGAPVILTGSGLNAAFTSGTIYYAVFDYSGINTTQFQLATSYLNAIYASSNPALYIIAASGTNDGTNIKITFPLGGTIGEAAHYQGVPEIASHRHTPSNNGGFVTDQSGTPNITTSAGGNQNQTTGFTSYTGNGYASNLIPPSTYANVFLKL